MPRKSKSAMSRLQNLGSNAKKRPSVTIEDVEDECEPFRCKNGLTNCCCRRLLFCQPDFKTQKSRLEEFITSRGHICDFYPKYHCELNFIEQYWGAAKFRYRNTTRTANIIEMEENMIACLDDVPLLQIIRYDI